MYVFIFLLCCCFAHAFMRDDDPPLYFSSTITNEMTNLNCFHGFSVLDDIAAIGCSDTTTVTIFRFNWTNYVWEFETDITSAAAGFGKSLALHKNVLAIGTDENTVHVFEYRNGEWSSNECVLKIEQAEQDDLVGGEVVLNNGHIYISAAGTDVLINEKRYTNAGAVYISKFTSPCTFGDVIRRESPIPTNDGMFSKHLAISNHYGLVHAPGNGDGDPTKDCKTGRSFLYSLDNPNKPPINISLYSIGIRGIDCTNVQFGYGSYLNQYDALTIGARYKVDRQQPGYAYSCLYETPKWKCTRILAPIEAGYQFMSGAIFSYQFVNPDTMKYQDLNIIYEGTHFQVYDPYDYVESYNSGIEIKHLQQSAFHLFITDGQQLKIYQNVKPHPVSPTGAPTMYPPEPSGISPGVAVGIVFGSLVGFAIAVYLYFQYMKPIPEGLYSPTTDDYSSKASSSQQPETTSISKSPSSFSFSSKK